MSDLRTTRTCIVWLTALMAPAVGAFAQDATVPGDFGTIRQAVAGATDVDGDGTVHIAVAAGTYNEELRIQRSNLELVGAGAGTTRIHGAGSAHTIYVERAQGVRIEGFTIEGVAPFDAIELRRAKGGAVVDNVISGGETGITVNGSRRVRVSDNDVSDADTEGIKISRSKRIVVRDNSSHDNGDVGIDADRSKKLRIEGNDSFDNGDHGFRDRRSTGNRYEENVAVGNASDGFRIEKSVETRLSRNGASENENGLRMKDTSASSIGGNLLTGNVEWGLRHKASASDDFNTGSAGVQAPPGNNDLSGNGKGPVRED